ncbi:MAG: DUF6766 family protein [Acidimicrobiales bacterium]
MPSYVATSQFRFASFQNWQSEFLAVGALVVLSIYLRQRGSPEPKPGPSSPGATRTRPDPRAAGPCPWPPRCASWPHRPGRP